MLPAMVVFAVIDDSLSAASPLGDAIETFVRREDAEVFIEEVRSDEPELAGCLRNDERELEAGAPTSRQDADVLRGVAFAVCEGGHHAREWKKARSAAQSQRRR